ncbi:MAG: tetratricopeptide repeat protein [Candidatus Krumholzibacteriota bacterium]|nr:tetratricopeptide repeat protein [Candidatus Krumholzibacteriota bacterium]
MARARFAIVLYLLAGAVSVRAEDATAGLDPAGAAARAEVLLDEGWWDDAHALLAGAVAAQPGDARLRFLLGRTHFLLDDFDTAEKELERARDGGLDGDASLHVWLGHTVGLKAQRGSKLRALGRAKRCRQEYERAVALDPGNVDALWSLMEYRLQAPGIAGGDREEARRLAGAIAERDTLLGHRARAEVLEADGDLAAAEAELRAAVILAPADRQNDYRLGAFLQRHGRAAAADSILDAVLAAEPTLISAWIEKGFRAQRREDWDEALVAFERVLELDPEEGSARYQVARTCIFAERGLDRAERCLVDYLARRRKGWWPAPVHAHWRLGQVYQLQGRRKDAIREYQAVLKLDPDYEDARNRLRKLGVR